MLNEQDKREIRHLAHKLENEKLKVLAQSLKETGYSNYDIALRLQIPESTVRYLIGDDEKRRLGAEH